MTPSNPTPNLEIRFSLEHGGKKYSARVCVPLFADSPADQDKRDDQVMQAYKTALRCAQWHWMHPEG